MRILVTGGGGFLGTKLLHVLSRKYGTNGTQFSKDLDKHVHLDITDRKQTETCINETKPDIVIHTAAIPDPDFCEKNKDKAFSINVKGTENLVLAVKKINAKLIYISTSYVFDGEKGNYKDDDDPKPVNYYGVTKLEGENIIKKYLKDYLILRIPKIYGFNSENDKLNFVTKVINKLKKNEKIYLDNEKIKCPTLIDDVAQVINKLIENNYKGVYHFSSGEIITDYNWALKIADFYGVNKKNIIASKGDHFAKRPKDASLNTSKISKLGIKPTKIEEGLKIMKKQKGCMFRMIYSVRPDMLVLNQSASSFRIKVGEVLAKNYPQKVDLVTAVPESSFFEATGYAAYSKIPFYFSVIRDYFTEKTLFSPTMEYRLRALRKKLIIVKDVVENKKIVLIDEAIISGSTLKVVIKQLKDAGVKEIHVRIPSPMMLSNCKYNVIAPDAKLIAKNLSNKGGVKKDEIEDKLAEYFGVDSLRYLSIEEFLSELIAKKDACIGCFGCNSDNGV